MRFIILLLVVLLLPTVVISQGQTHRLITEAPVASPTPQATVFHTLLAETHNWRLMGGYSVNLGRS